MIFRETNMEKPAIGNRIIVLGCSGSGKSVFAKDLQRRAALPLYHLDNVWWRADRTHITREEFDCRLEKILRGETWIIDGDYSRTYEPRFLRCDTVIFLDYSEAVCLEGITQRVGKARGDIPWTENELDPALVEQVRSYRTENRPKIYELIGKYPDRQTYVFKTREQAREWINRL